MMTDPVATTETTGETQKVWRGFEPALLPPMVTTPPRVPIPASIAKAIVKVMQEVKTIEKDARNEHGKYDYASVDSVYAGVQKAMSEAGLIVVPMEESVKKLDGDKFIEFIFSFIVATETDTWEDPRNKRTVYMQWMGPQTFQGGQSYCEKAFLKGLFKLDTGDAEQEAVTPGQAEEPKGKKTKNAKIEPLDAAAAAEQKKQALADLKTSDDLEAWATKWGATIQRLPDVDAAEVREAFKKKRG